MKYPALLFLIVFQLALLKPYAAWDFSAYGNHCQIKFDPTSLPMSGVTTELPLLFRITTSSLSDFWPNVQTDGDDIRFTDVNGDSLAFELESWVYNTAAEVWIYLPSIDVDSVFTINMYWNNPSAISASQSGNVFTVDKIFNSVWHLSAPNELIDATVNQNTLSTTGSPSASTQHIGGGYNLNGSSGFAAGVGPSLAGSTDFTVSAWIKTSANTEGIIIQQRDPTGAEGEYVFWMDPAGQLNFQISNGGNQFSFNSVGTVNDGNWHHVVAVRKSDEGLIYIDGTLDASVSGTVKDLNGSLETFIGYDGSDLSRFFNGSIDEVRVNHHRRNNRWVLLNYETQKLGQNIVTTTTPVYFHPVITEGPVNQTVTEGATATFSVQANGGGLSYQWQKDEMDIPGANSNSYTTPATVIGDNNSQYRCIVSNPGGSDTSSTATLTVNVVINPPQITTNPQSQTVNERDPVQFSVEVLGLNLSFQWQKDGNNISGATDSIYTISQTEMADDAGAFRCIVTNGVGGDTSEIASLAVHRVKPVITTQPVPDTVTEGGSAAFSVAILGTGLTYQWQKNSQDISGADAAVYNIAEANYSDSGAVFKCVITNDAGSVTSVSVKLVVNMAIPKITKHPGDAEVYEGQSIEFSVTATGHALSYQWQKNDSDINGANNSKFLISQADRADSGASYQCFVTNLAGSVSSKKVTLHVDDAPPAPVISKQPVEQSVIEGQEAVFTIEATGASLEYQWQRGGNDILGADSSSYLISPTTLADSGLVFRCKVSNLGGTTTSEPVTLKVNKNLPIPPVLVSPANEKYTTDPTIIFFWLALEGNVTYQLQISDDSTFNEVLIDKTDISSTQAQEELTEPGTYYWRVRALNQWGNSPFSDPFTINFDNIISTQEMRLGFPREFKVISSFQNEQPGTFLVGVPARAKTKLDLINPATGQVYPIFHQNLNAGWYRVHYPKNLKYSGLYVYRLQSDDKITAGRLILLPH